MQNTIRKIVEKINIVSVIRKHVSLHREGLYLVGRCPFHEDDFETINLLLENERPLEVADKVTNIDAMSIEELLAFKSLLTGYMVTQKNQDTTK